MRLPFHSTKTSMGVPSTYSWVSEVDTHKGAHVTKGDVIALSGNGHPGSTEPTHLHFGVKKDGEYVEHFQALLREAVADRLRTERVVERTWSRALLSGTGPILVRERL